MGKMATALHDRLQFGGLVTKRHGDCTVRKGLRQIPRKGPYGFALR